MLCLCHYGPALFCFQTNLGRENSASYFKIEAGQTFSYQGHMLVTLYIWFSCSDWSKFDGWVHVENLRSILKLAYFDSWINTCYYCCDYCYYYYFFIIITTKERILIYHTNVRKERKIKDEMNKKIYKNLLVQ